MSDFKLIILNGPSGCGKSTMLNHLSKENIAPVWSTGDLVKCIMGGRYNPTEKLIAEDALMYFYDNRDALLMRYEEKKAEDPNFGFKVIACQEAFRGVTPDFHAMTMGVLISILEKRGKKCLVTETINQEEYEDLLTEAELCDFETCTVVLNCENPKPLASAKVVDNRHSINPKGLNITVPYKLEDSIEIIEWIVGEFTNPQFKRP